MNYTKSTHGNVVLIPSLLKAPKKRGSIFAVYFRHDEIFLGSNYRVFQLSQRKLSKVSYYSMEMKFVFFFWPFS